MVVAVEMQENRHIWTERSPEGGIMKTGNEANRKGTYSSECCDYEVTFERGQTLTRCPKCSSLTTWDLTEDVPAKKVA
jgi:hypothetical protein